MRRFLALATLFVLSLSRFGAPVPAHAHALAWATDRTPQEMLASAPSARLTAFGVRELGPRVPPRAHAPWTTPDVADAFAPPFPIVRSERSRPWWKRSAPSAWHRFPYYPTAPPRLS
jgi:hypothetical protein